MKSAFLHNRVNSDLLRKRIQDDPTPRTTLSFYRYVILEDVSDLRNTLYQAWSNFGVIGRIYIAREGVNAQMSIPNANLALFRNWLDAFEPFHQIPFKIAVEDDGKSFFKLAIKVRKKIVADGLDDDAFDVTNVGNHLDAVSFNEALSNPDTIVVDMRNHYESEVGHFEGALKPDADTFREELPQVLEMLKNQESKKILMYCTGGIRCEKASAFLRHHGFKDVNQLHGGIIAYAREIKEKGLPSKFLGKNFVFDERLGERITDDIVSHCHQCEAPCDDYTNCKNEDCNLLFIQCKACAEAFAGCCTEACKEIALLPDETRKTLRKGQAPRTMAKIFNKGRLRPHPEQLIRFKYASK